MIFCTVGNDSHRFARFEELVDNLSTNLPQTEAIIFQHGYSTPVIKKNITNYRFIDPSTFKKYLEQASSVYSHGGAGTLLRCAELQIVPYVLSRHKKYGEHINDHQKEIVNQFYEMGLIFDLSKNSQRGSRQKIDFYPENILVNEIENLLLRYLK